MILILVLVLVYLILAGQFESFINPLIILTAAPLALAGGLITIWLAGLTLNIYTQIALILLVGLNAKNAILLVEFANQLRAEGKEPREAALDAAGLRLRPILMTSVATMIGAVPLILESGAGAEARRALGLVTSGGLIFGTLLTLVTAIDVLEADRSLFVAEQAILQTRKAQAANLVTLYIALGGAPV